MMKLSKLWKYTASACALLLVLLTCFMMISPYEGIVVITDSMRPSIPKWSFVLIYPSPATQLSAGDVILFYAPDQGVLVLHRLIEIDSANQLLMTKGDTNHQADLFPTSWDMLRGKYVTHIPLLGWLVFYAKQYAVALFFIGLATLTALTGMFITKKKSVKS